MKDRDTHRVFDYTEVSFNRIRTETQTRSNVISWMFYESWQVKKNTCFGTNGRSPHEFQVSVRKKMYNRQRGRVWRSDQLYTLSIILLWSQTPVPRDRVICKINKARCNGLPSWTRQRKSSWASLSVICRRAEAQPRNYQEDDVSLETNTPGERGSS